MAKNCTVCLNKSIFKQKHLIVSIVKKGEEDNGTTGIPQSVLNLVLSKQDS